MTTLMDTMVYLLKVLGARFMRTVASLVVKLQTPTQARPPRPAATLHLARTASTDQGRQRRSPLRVDVYLPAQAKGGSLPVVINVHGSGFVLSTFGHDAPFCQLIADQVHCVVLDVAYSKAPEHPYPRAGEDIDSVLEWVAERKLLEESLRASNVTLQPDRIALTGFSSGGNLVLTTCVRARASETLSRIRAVVAFYPS